MWLFIYIFISFAYHSNRQAAVDILTAWYIFSSWWRHPIWTCPWSTQALDLLQSLTTTSHFNMAALLLLQICIAWYSWDTFLLLGFPVDKRFEKITCSSTFWIEMWYLIVSLNLIFRVINGTIIHYKMKSFIKMNDINNFQRKCYHCSAQQYHISLLISLTHIYSYNMNYFILWQLLYNIFNFYLFSKRIYVYLFYI